jgi:hypothetical protein
MTFVTITSAAFMAPLSFVNCHLPPFQAGFFDLNQESHTVLCGLLGAAMR